jgi:DNA-binding NarL/FixJ family response regulator
MRLRNTRTSTTSTINAKAPTFDEICEKAGFGDLKQDNRSGQNPMKRMAIWHYMNRKGIRLSDIARQSNRSHATVWSGIRKFKDYLGYGDRVSLALRDKINEVVSENG